MKFRLAGLVLFVISACWMLVGQEAQPVQPSTAIVSASENAATISPALSSTLSADEIRALIREASEKDMENDKKQRDYTYIEREEEHHLDGKGQVKSTETTTHEVMMLCGAQIERLIAKNDKPLSEEDATKEEERIRKMVEKRKNESDEQRAKRAQQQEKDGEETRKFVSEIDKAFNFRLAGVASVDGRDTYIIDAEPRPDFRPHEKGAKFLSKFRFRVWIDRAEHQWVKLDAEAIDTVSFGLFLARIHKGSRVQVEQTRVNDEVWLPRHVAVKVDVRVALLKNFNLEEDVTYRDYKKFRTDIKIVPGVQEVQGPR